ncbi:MAG: TraB/GumN family protein [Alkalimonas sp.]|nr:TraB/GumN family protein [Alkalimonas sp.]
MRCVRVWRRLVHLVVVSASLLPAWLQAESVVWKVSKDQDYLYLAGTVAILPEREFALPAAIEAAYHETNRLILEVQLPQSPDTQSMLTLLQALHYSEGEQLLPLLTAETRQQLQQHLLAAGVDLLQLNDYKPAMVTVQLLAIEKQRLQLSGFAVAEHLAAQARKEGRVIDYLESFEQQLQLLATLGQGYEEEFIRASLLQAERFASDYHRQLDAWHSGDLQQLAPFLHWWQQNDPVTYQRMFCQRQQHWVERIKTFFDNGYQELVLLDVLHLAGEQGILAQLQAQGYRVKPLMKPD